MKVAAIIQARVGSTRLEGKVLRKICEKEILLHVVDRILAADLIDQVIVATTENSVDDAIAQLVSGYHEKVKVFRGSEDDVLNRYYKAALEFDVDVVVRITSDCPLTDPNIINVHVKEFLKRKVDYLSSRIEKRTWPHGLDCEVFTIESLQKANQLAKDKHQREHVTPYIMQGEDFSKYELKCDPDLSIYRWTVDYEEDLEFVSAIYKTLYKENKLFGMDSVISLLKEKPELLEINKKHIDISF